LLKISEIVEELKRLTDDSSMDILMGNEADLDVFNSKLKDIVGYMDFYMSSAIDNLKDAARILSQVKADA